MTLPDKIWRNSTRIMLEYLLISRPQHDDYLDNSAQAGGDGGSLNRCSGVSGGLPNVDQKNTRCQNKAIAGAPITLYHIRYPHGYEALALTAVNR